MKNYQPESYLLYDRPYNCRIRVELDEEIDGEILSKVANTAIKRYPYFKVYVAVNDEKYELKQNDRPIVVYETRKPNFPLGSEEVNWHLVSIDYIWHIIFRLRLAVLILIWI